MMQEWMLEWILASQAQVVFAEQKTQGGHQNL